MTKARCLAGFYVILFTLGCTYCGKDVALEPQPVSADAELRNATTCGDCGANAFCNSLGVCVPNAWFCGPMYYHGGDGCDCDCGAPDPDCDDLHAQRWCYAAGRTEPVRDCSQCGDAGEPDDQLE